MNHPVRLASPQDAAGVLQLIQEHASFEQSVASLSLDDLKAILSAESPLSHLLVVEERGVPIGYAAITFDFSLWLAHSYGHLDCLFVAAAFRGQGVGKQLFNTAVGFARAKGADRLEWQTPVWNSDAIRFYHRTGAFGVTKERFARMLQC